MDSFNQTIMELQQGESISLGRKVFITNSTSQQPLGRFVPSIDLTQPSLEEQVYHLKLQVNRLYQNPIIRFFLWISAKFGA